MEQEKKNPKLTRLHKLATDFTALSMDPDIGETVNDIMAGFAFTKNPSLAKKIASMAKDPKARQDVISRVASYIGWQGSPLHTDSQQEETVPQEDQPMGPMGMGAPTPEPVAPETSGFEPMAPEESAEFSPLDSETAGPAPAAPQAPASTAPRAQPFKPAMMGMGQA